MNILKPQNINSILNCSKSLNYSSKKGFFQKIIEQVKNHHNSTQIKLIQKENDSYNDDYLNNDFVKYVQQLGVPPLNSYNVVNPKIAETELFSQKTMFRIAAQSQFRRWMTQYETLVDSIVQGNMDEINKICEERLCQKFETFLEKIEKSQLKCVKIMPAEVLDIMVYPEFIKHRQIEGVSINRRLNHHEAQYFKTDSKDKLIYQKINEKKQSKWALLNIKDSDDKENDKNELVLNQYNISFQTNMRLNIVRRADETDIVYGSDDPTLIAVHYFQIENVRSHLQETDYFFTDIDNILHGNPYVSS